MANEKMMILKMLEEGKITADEAARLMDASSEQKAGGSSSAPPPRPQHTAGGASSHAYSGSSNANNGAGTYDAGHKAHGYSGQGSNNTSQNMGFDDFANDLSRKFDTFARDMEPKIQRFTETVVEKTASMADKISKSMATPPSARPSSSGGYTGSMKNYQEKNFEMMVSPGYCELNLSGINGDIQVSGYNGDKITARVTYRPKFAVAAIELMKLGDKYYLNYDEDSFEFVTVDAFVPEAMFKNIKIETINGKIFASTLVTEYLTVSGINTKSEFRNIMAENFYVDVTNGGINIFNVSGRKGSIEAFNSPISATSLDIENLKLSSNNSTVNLNIDYFSNYNNYTWVLDASNGKFVMNVPSSPELGYYVKARTSLNSVKVGLTGMNYLVNNPSFVEAKSISFDASPKQIRLSIETSNAPLIIN